ASEISERWRSFVIRQFRTRTCFFFDSPLAIRYSSSDSVSWIVLHHSSSLSATRSPPSLKFAETLRIALGIEVDHCD
ncbi:unnamed protein product, partial [Brassica oleracea var. botrytis]